MGRLSFINRPKIFLLNDDKSELLEVLFSFIAYFLLKSKNNDSSIYTSEDPGALSEDYLRAGADSLKILLQVCTRKSVMKLASLFHILTFVKKLQSSF